jgi:hypothetical protein
MGKLEIIYCIQRRPSYCTMQGTLTPTCHHLLADQCRWANQLHLRFHVAMPHPYLSITYMTDCIVESTVIPSLHRYVLAIPLHLNAMFYM